MKFLKNRRSSESFDPPLEDPLAGIANLFDASVVFIVSLIIALFMAYNMLELLNPKSEVTLVKKAEDGKVEIIIKKGKEIRVKKVTDKELAGEGIKLGTAYQLKDGRTVYVPE
jgi:hypothetical protein